jgi:hypothetical protein
MSLYVPYYRPYIKHNTSIHVPGGIRAHDPSKRAAEDPRLTPHGHWDRRLTQIIKYNSAYERLLSFPIFFGWGQWIFLPIFSENNLFWQ